ncbi:hypothetical protein ASF84_06855 [Pseudomonas sp. Leaf127]|nr:hypothetical protein ASF84_06855 [Pseudomonas sp. Leaf127]
MLRVQILINCRRVCETWALIVQRIFGGCSKGHVRGTGDEVALFIHNACMRSLRRAYVIDLGELIFSLVLTASSLAHSKGE